MPRHEPVRSVSVMPPSQPEAPRTKNPRYIPPRGDNRPVEKLPTEILAYIFELGTLAEVHEEDWDVEEDDGDEEYEDINDGSDDDDDMGIVMPGSFNLGKRNGTNGTTEKTWNLPFQVRMSHVCRRWRQIALDTPVLWTTLDFTEPRPFNKSQEWLVRSRECPLDLLIDLSLPDPDDDDIGLSVETLESSRESQATKLHEDLTCILDLVIKHIGRWRTFELTTSIYEHMHYALQRLEEGSRDSGAPLLQSLRLYCGEAYEELADISDFESFRRYFSPLGGYTPKLLQLELHGVHLDWEVFIPASERSPSSLNAEPSCTSNLREIELAYHTRDVRPRYEVFINLIRCAPTLTSLKLLGSGPQPRLQSRPTEPLYLPNLRHLTLGFFDEAYAVQLAHLLYAPNLKSITLDFDESDDDYTRLVDELVSDAPLTNATPANSSTSADSALARHKRNKLANVTELKLSGLPCSDTCAAKLYTACPNLKRLHLNMNFLQESFFFSLIQEETVTDDMSDGPASRGPLAPRSSSIGPVLCKHLEAVSISGMTGLDYVRFVKKRRALGSPISEIKIDELDVLDPEERDWLSKNVKSVSFVEFSDDEEEMTIIDEDIDSGDEDQEWEFDVSDGGDEEDDDEDGDYEEDDDDDEDWEDED